MPNRFIPSGQTWTLPELLEAYRIKAGYTVEQAAQYLQMDIDKYKNLETGATVIDIFSVEMLIEAFKLPKIAKKIAFDPRKPPYCHQLAKFRVKAGLTSEAVAHHLGVAQPTYAGYETGRREPDIETLIKLAKFYDTSVDILVGYRVPLSDLANLYTKREEEWEDSEVSLEAYMERDKIPTEHWGIERLGND